MNNIISKVIGWILLIAGVAVISWSLYNSYQIFTGKAEVPVIFEMPESAPVKVTDDSIQGQMEQMLQDQMKNLLPVDSMTKVMNFGIWSGLAFILIFGGMKIAEIGIKLIKG